jgi:hypothetical protein
MKLDRQGVLFKSGVGFYWPFPRLRYRLRAGHWCEHVRPVPGGRTYVAPGHEWTITVETEPAWEPGDGGRADGWHMIDAGQRQMRRCSLCTHCEFR